MTESVSNLERNKLNRAIWSISDNLRGNIDGWDFKVYVLGMMCYRYLSENLINTINESKRADGDLNFDYATLTDTEALSDGMREELIKTKGFFLLPSELFCNVRKRAGNDDNLSVTLSQIFQNIDSSNEPNFSGILSDFEPNDKRLGPNPNKVLVNLIEGIASMDLDYQDHSNDTFGDAYEHLMTMYASNAGKSGGEFFTPQEVSRLLTLIAVNGKRKVSSVYDPACGSGSLLLQAAKILGKENVKDGFYGQEVNLTTYNLCRINMLLHDIGYDKFEIAHEDTLIHPQHKGPFEVVVSNPPYSVKWVGDADPELINDGRFSRAGVLAPKSKADLAFVMHSLYCLDTQGTAAIVCFPGVMYRGGAEQKIRKYLVDNNFIDCVIQLPDNLFYGTSIATCILVLKKNKTDNSTLFIDASSEFVKASNNNMLTEENIQKIVGAYISRKDVEHFARCVPHAEIAANSYKLAVSMYVQPESSREVIDIKQLNAELEQTVARQQVLRQEIAKLISEIES